MSKEAAAGIRRTLQIAHRITLDQEFSDKDGIAKKSQKELEQFTEIADKAALFEFFENSIKDHIIRKYEGKWEIYRDIDAFAFGEPLIKAETIAEAIKEITRD